MGGHRGIYVHCFRFGSSSSPGFLENFKVVVSYPIIYDVLMMHMIMGSDGWAMAVSPPSALP